MNLELYKHMRNIKEAIKAEYKRLHKEFDEKELTATIEEKLAIKDEYVRACTAFNMVQDDIISYEKASEAMTKEEFQAYEESLATKYHFDLHHEKDKAKDEGEEVAEVVEPKVTYRREILTDAAIAALIVASVVGITYGVKGCQAENDNVRAAVYEESEQQTPVPTIAPTPVATATPTATPAPTATPVVTPEPASEVEAAIEEVVAEIPFEDYGNFVDVNDEAQLRARATWYYETYIANQNKSQAGANMFTVEDIMNDMRMINGEFMLNEDGSIRYNDTEIIAVANDLHTIANYDSFKQYGTQIYFTPMAPLFEDGSLAQKAAIQLDEGMKKVVDAIRAEDDEAFVAAAKEWGIVVINEFNYVDFTGEYVNIYQVDAPTSFALYHAMSAKYASTILEYSEAHHLDICIEYCDNYETGHMEEKALSEIMYDINERAMDAVAVRSGHQAEYEANNLSLPENLYVLAKDYFNSKYDLEVGYSRRLN